MIRFCIPCFIILISIACHKKRVEIQADPYDTLSLQERQQPENALKSFDVARGVELELFASEPMVVNPTNIDVDDKGRVWALESPYYGESGKPPGRIVILEDTDQDGKADIRKIFYEGHDVHVALGIAVLGNEIYVTRSPNLLVFTDENGDDVPDSKEILLTGMGHPGDHSAHALVFGPDGKFYFNMGNAGGDIRNRDSILIYDTAGNPATAYGEDYIGGMIFRCNPDGSQLEVIAHNFRNNYEVAIDSYGNLWQSDNDDDGNASCRINFILEFGNYGYLDEVRRESWESPRTNMENEIPARHWHQNDPGVVPNLLITGAGSPAGILMYEGEALPQPFQGHMIHADAGPNVVRTYPVQKDLSGYTAEILNLIKSRDQWFRPVDLATAPDGSVMVADWYDPGVGGAVAADSLKGRIYRISQKAGEYSPNSSEIRDIPSAIEGLKSPNLATRYLAWVFLNGQGEAAEQSLVSLFEHSKPVYRARAIWLLGKIPLLEDKYIELALQDDDPRIRIIGIRLARQHPGDQFTNKVRPVIRDPDPGVRREILIGLHLEGETKSEIWAELAGQHIAGDRWYLEALGIAAYRHWDSCLERWLIKAGENWNSEAGWEIIWRARTPAALPYLGKMIADPRHSGPERLSYFRAFDFHEGKLKNEVLIDLLDTPHPDIQEITSLVLQHVDAEKIIATPKLERAIQATLDSHKDSQAFLNIIEKFTVKNRYEDMSTLISNTENPSIASSGMKMLLDPDRLDMAGHVGRTLQNHSSVHDGFVRALGLVGSIQSLEMLKEIVLDSLYSLNLRSQAIHGLGNSWTGEEWLLECVEDDRFDKKLEEIAGSVLFNVYRVWIQEEAAKYLNRPESIEGRELPPIRNMVASTGNLSRGEEVFDIYCGLCHEVEEKGHRFGPELSLIGTKLSKEALYRSIMFPSEGISLGYEGVRIQMKDGSELVGILRSQNQNQTELRREGGVIETIPKSDIHFMTPLTESLMPNLSLALSEQQIVDLVEYLSQLQ